MNGASSRRTPRRRRDPRGSPRPNTERRAPFACWAFETQVAWWACQPWRRFQLVITKAKMEYRDTDPDLTARARRCALFAAFLAPHAALARVTRTPATPREPVVSAEITV